MRCWHTSQTVTERPPSDTQILEAERDRLAQIVDVLPIGVVLMDTSGRVTLENR